MATLASLDGDGFSVGFFRTVPSSHYNVDYCAIVINGVISLPIAILAYFCLPDTPSTAKPNWLFSERVSIAMSSEQARKSN
jgi:hypothetical protein